MAIAVGVELCKHPAAFRRRHPAKVLFDKLTCSSLTDRKAPFLRVDLTIPIRIDQIKELLERGDTSWSHTHLCGPLSGEVDLARTNELLPLDRS